MKLAGNGRITLAFIVAPAAATMSLGLLVFALWPSFADDPNAPLGAALHFMLYGASVIFPLSIIAGLPLFLLFRHLHWLSRRAVFAGGLLLSLAYPALVWLQNPQSPGLVTPIHYAVCAICGGVAAWAFCAVSGLSSGRLARDTAPSTRARS